MDYIDENTSLELIAISTGSVKASELRKSLEWQVFDFGANQYIFGLKTNTLEYKPQWISSKGKYALMFDVVLAFDGFAAKRGPLGSEFDKALEDMDQTLGQVCGRG
jgi:hypothetical protein